MIDGRRRTFGAGPIKQVLRALGNELDAPVAVLLVGGGAMSIRGD